MDDCAEPHGWEFLRSARSFAQAAKRLTIVAGQDDDVRTLRDPINFLYFHAIELALKAYLRCHRLAIAGTERRTHNLSHLYAEALHLGLRVATDDSFDLPNVIELLERGNESQGLRYVNHKSMLAPEFGWSAEVVDALIDAVDHAVEMDPHRCKAWRARIELTCRKPETVSPHR
jgi:hypothetical protein